MKITLQQEIQQLNPWLATPNAPILNLLHFHPRIQAEKLLLSEWDPLCTVLTGPRRAGKTTLGKYLCEQLIKAQRFKSLLYLNCDYLEIRNWLTSPLFVTEALQLFRLQSPIIFIDEVQRLDNPGLLLKALIDLKLPIKLMASGSSQLEIKSKVQEHLTGRQFNALVLPLSYAEWGEANNIQQRIVYGSYPQVIHSTEPELLLSQLYQDYVAKDIVEILRLNSPDILQKLIMLLAHSTGQLVNYSQLAVDCQVSVTLIKNYLSILEQTYVIYPLKPFTGNKRVEITSNPIYYFIDNGFRNYALRNFNDLNFRTDAGFLVENLIFQEIYKYKTQNFLNFDIHYWRTKSGAEVDFVLYKNQKNILPIEAKYRGMRNPMISRGFRSFIQAYQPKHAIIITKDLIATETIENCQILFIPLEQLGNMLNAIMAFACSIE